MKWETHLQSIADRSACRVVDEGAVVVREVPVPLDVRCQVGNDAAFK
jgi:hypothetical protein